MIKKFAVALAATTLIAAPVAASAATTDLRADTVVEGQAIGEGGGTMWLIYLAAAALAAYGLYTVIDDSPSSP